MIGKSAEGILQRIATQAKNGADCCPSGSWARPGHATKGPATSHRMTIPAI
jgi:hypothetical protein